MHTLSGLRAAVARAALGAACVAALATTVHAQGLKSYDSTKKEFWSKPAPDWFLGDETEAQKGLAPPAGPALPASKEDLQKSLGAIKLPKGFKIEVYARGVNSARQMARGDKGTLFVGAFGVGNVYAIVDKDGKKEVKTIVIGLKMPIGVAFRDGAPYVVDIDKILEHDNAEASLDKMPEAKVVYDDMPPYIPHGWKCLAFDTQGRLYVPLGPPCNICLPPAGLSQVRRVNPATGEAEVMAIGVRNSVGGDVDPRTGDYWFTENARDRVSDDLPSDKLNHIARQGAHFGYPYCHQGNLLDPKYGKGYKCSDFTPPVLNLGAHVAPLGMKFYTGHQFPTEYANSIFIAEHGSWNRHKYQGARIVLAHGAADIAAGAAKAEACVPCHGPPGISRTAEVPSLAGQPDGFLQWQLVYFRTGTRKSPVMQPMAATLKDDDIRNLAAYFAAQKPPRPDPAAKADEALAAAGRKVAQANRCVSCHRDDFSGTQATARIAAQREDYLLKALRDFKGGKRVGGGVAAMADVVYPLSDDDLRALAHFLARFSS